jgi:hypothetical protein
MPCHIDLYLATCAAALPTAWLADMPGESGTAVMFTIHDVNNGNF